MTTSRGFTLVETMVAISIVAISIVGPLFALQKGVTASYTARDRLIASALAQEGLEYVHAIRDSNYLFAVANPSIPRNFLWRLDGSTSNGVTSPNCTAGAACIVDMVNDTVSACATPTTCTPLYLSTVTNQYNTQTASGNNIATRFTRSVKLSIVNVREVTVTSTVTWRTGQNTYSVSATENLQDWL